MRTLYIQCNMGAAGDMLSAALFELLEDKKAFLEKLNQVGIPNVKVTAEKTEKCGITGTHFHVLIDGEEEGEEHKHHAHHHEHAHAHDHHHGQEHHHHHNGIKDIEHLVKEHLNLEEKVKEDILEVFSDIAKAESKVHGKEMDQIHFHEVGTMDAVADITAVCMLMQELKAEKIVASAVHVGSGTVKCAHGILPVPAPATSLLLQGVPIYSGEVKGELCTPTGAALLKHFASEFGQMPLMKVEKIGYGMGKKDFEQANCVRVFLGETDERKDSINELSCNLDDMTGEEIGFALDRLYEAGAAEVYTLPAATKKNRPAVILNVLCKDEVKEEIVRTIFKHTSTIGIREKKMNRYVLDRGSSSVDTIYGKVRRKDCAGYGSEKSKYEFDDLAKIAREKGKSIAEIRKKIEEYQ